MESLYEDFDFDLLKSPDFKEDSVRSFLIDPLLKELGYSAQGEHRILLTKKLNHQFITTGSTGRPLTNFPDYLLEVKGKYAWVLDAKGPNEDIKTGKNVEQTYFYAIHHEVRVDYYALCNGNEFILFHISQPEALLYFSLTEIEKYWQALEQTLAAQAFAGNSTPPATLVPQIENSIIFLESRFLK